MYRYVLAVAIVFSLCGLAQAQDGPKPDVRSFELTAIAPPTPALKYQLLYDDLADRLYGNAALLYLDAILLMGPDAKEKGTKALEAYDAKDMATFKKLADELAMKTVFDELDLAARREECDWQPPFREKGVDTLLPHLEPLAHGMTWLIKVKALRQIEDGQAAEAIPTLRLGYELANKVARERAAISGLVSLGISGQMNDAMVRLMNRPESPNLYWALCEFPPRQPIFRYALDGERSWVALSVPSLMKLRNGEQLSADTWRELFAYIWAVMDSTPEAGKSAPTHPDPAQASPELLRRARREYAEIHKLSGRGCSQVGTDRCDGRFLLSAVHGPVRRPIQATRAAVSRCCCRWSKAEADRMTEIRKQQPDNPFQVFGYYTVVVRFAYADRQLAALTAVEALRSYAAAHDGKLPEKLADVTATPVPENPATGEPFEYRVENGIATISDSKFEPALTYTVKIRK